MFARSGASIDFPCAGRARLYRTEWGRARTTHAPRERKERKGTCRPVPITRALSVRHFELYEHAEEIEKIARRHRGRSQSQMSGGAPGPRGGEDQAALDLLASWQDTEEGGNAESGSSESRRAAPEREETPKSVILQNPAHLLSRGR